jgi:LysM repeat protein
LPVWSGCQRISQDITVYDIIAPRLTTGASSNPSGTPIFIEPLLTATPNPDGSVVHVVGYGQALWSIAIAYGVKINDIRRLNNLPFDSTHIYTGQKLIIRPPGTVSPSITASHTPEVTQVAPPPETVPPSPAASPYASPSRTQAPGLPATQTMSTNTIGMVLLVILAFGLLAFVVWSAYRR